MTNYFYTDASGQKQGAVDDQQLQALVTQGIITPESLLETESGHKGQAGQIPSLHFPETTPHVVVPSDEPNPFTNAMPQTSQSPPLPATQDVPVKRYSRRRRRIAFIVGAIFLLLLGGVWMLYPSRITTVTTDFKDGDSIYLSVEGDVTRMVIYQSPVGKDKFNDKGFSKDDGYGDNLVPYDKGIDIRIWSRTGRNHEVMRINAKELLDDLQEQIKASPNDKTKWKTVWEDERGKVTFTFTGIQRARVRIRIWNDATLQFTEFDEPGCRFNAGRKNVVIIHGMGESTSTDWIQTTARRIRKCESETNIIGVDWGGNERENLWMPFATARLLSKIATQADSLLFGKDSLNLEPSKTHVIGFSHGCHIAGMIGMKHPSNPIARLTVLDPSNRIVHWSLENLFGAGWDKRAAKFVDMYASSIWAGTKKCYGHKTFFVESKRASKSTTVADHKYATKWFLSTIGDKDTRFGYSIDVTQPPDSGRSGTIRSSLPLRPTPEDLDDEITNEIEE